MAGGSAANRTAGHFLGEPEQPTTLLAIASPSRKVISAGPKAEP